MCHSDAWLKALRHLIQTVFRVLLGFLGLVLRACRSRSAVEAENLFLRKQLALFRERKSFVRCLRVIEGCPPRSPIASDAED